MDIPETWEKKNALAPTSPAGSILHILSQGDRQPENFPSGSEAYLQQIKSQLAGLFGPVYLTIPGAVIDGVYVDLLLIQPTTAFPFWTVATAGMGFWDMKPPGNYDVTNMELVLHLPADWPFSPEALLQTQWNWPFALVAHLASIPSQYGVWAGPMTSFPIAAGLSGTSLSVAMLVPSQTKKLMGFQRSEAIAQLQADFVDHPVEVLQHAPYQQRQSYRSSDTVAAAGKQVHIMKIEMLTALEDQYRLAVGTQPLMQLLNTCAMTCHPQRSSLIANRYIEGQRHWIVPEPQPLFPLYSPSHINRLADIIYETMDNRQSASINLDFGHATKEGLRGNMTRLADNQILIEVSFYHRQPLISGVFCTDFVDSGLPELLPMSSPMALATATSLMHVNKHHWKTS